MAESTASLRAEMLALSGVDILKDPNTFKSTYQIMDELSQKWEGLSDIAQATIIELMAGKHQGNIMSSLMANFDTARKALETSANSSGSAMAEHAKWSDSLQAKLNKLKATWQSLSQSFMSSNFLKGAISALTGFVDVLDTLVSKLGALPTLLSAFALFKSFTGSGIFKPIKDEATGLATGITNIFSQAAQKAESTFRNIGTNTESPFNAQLEKDKQALTAYSKIAEELRHIGQSVPKDVFGDIFEGTTSSAQEWAKNGKIATEGIEAFVKAQRKVEVSSLAQNKSLSTASAIIKEYFNGCQNVGLKQTEFADAVAKTNPQLAANMTSASSAAGALLGYGVSAAGAAVKSLALRAAITGLNMAFSTLLTMGITALISWGIKKFDEWYESADELSDRIDDVTTKYKDQHSALTKLKGDYDTSNEDSMISKYGELSKGVNELGENLSLTADEYSEYKNIVNQIASQTPSLVAGYNSQGQAILKNANDVDALTESYKDLIRAENEEIIGNKGVGKDILKDFENDLRETSAYYETIVKGDYNQDIGVENFDFKHLDKLEKLMSLSGEELEKELNKLTTTDVERISSLLEEQGIERNLLGSGDAGWETKREHIVRALKKDKAEIKNVLDDAQADFDAYADKMGTITEAYFSDAFLGDYEHMSERMQSIISNATSGLGADFYAQFLGKENGYELLTQSLDSILKAFDGLDSVEASEFEAAFNLKTQFNNGEISYGEYVGGIKDAASLIESLEIDPEVKTQIKLALNTKEITDNYAALKERLTSDEYSIQLSSEKAEAFLGDLTASEYAVAVDLIVNGGIDLSNIDSEKLRAEIERQAKIKEALDFEANLEIDTTSLEAFNTALSESASAVGLTTESIESLKSKYKDLEGYDPATLFETTANGVKVNREEVAKLEKQYQDLNKSEVQKHLDTLIGEYNRLTKEIDDNNNASERARLLSEREGYYDKIQELAQYQAQLEGVTGAYQRWINAQSVSEDYEGYGAVAQGKKTVEDEIKRGFLGNASREYIDLLSGEDLVGKSVDDYIAAWNKLDDKVGSTSYSINDFFTLDDDGNITSKGIDRFFDGIQKDFEGSIAKFNEKSGEWEYDFSQENLQKIQDEWGIGIEAIGLLLEAAGAAGYNVDWDGILDNIDLDTSKFETLVQYAESAQKAFNDLDLEGIDDVDFNFKTTNIEDAKTELEKAQEIYKDLITNDDDTINLDAEGADKMRVILAALTRQKQQLERPAIMDIEVPFKEAETNIGKATTAVKNLQNNLWKLEQSTYDPDINSGEVQTEISNIITELNTLEKSDPEIYAKLGLDDAQIEGLKTAIGSIQADIKAGVEPSQEDLATVQSTIQGIDATVVANVLTGESTVGTGIVDVSPNKTDFGDGFTGTGIITVSPNTTDLGNVFTGSGTAKITPSLTTSTLTVTVKEKKVSEVNGTANVNGTAFSDGSITTGRAFKRGDWGIKGSGTALVGELGMETLVRGGRFYTIGDSGAEFIKYRQGDIIFNHKQTEELFKNGKVTSNDGRGKMFADGSAFADGSYPSSGKAFWGATSTTSSFVDSRKKRIESIKATVEDKKAKSAKSTSTYGANVSGSSISDKANSDKPKKSSGGNGGDPKAEQEVKETVDWIEKAIDRIERAISQLDTKANSVYHSWTERNQNLTDEISRVKNEIDLQQKAYERYLEEANSVGLDADYAEKVRNGEIDIEKIYDEDLAEKIQQYEDWYNKALDCKDAILDLKETESELYEQRFEHVQSQYDGILQGYEHTENMLNEYISQAEEQGYIVSKKYYQALVANEKSNIDELKKEQADLVAARDEAVESGKITKQSEEWYLIMPTYLVINM